MSDAAAIWIDEEQVAANVSLAEAIDIVQEGFVGQARGTAVAMDEARLVWPGGSLHATGAVSEAAGLSGTRAWSESTGPVTPLLLLFDRETGALRAVIEAAALGQLRSAAVSGIATRWLSVPEATELALIGTGREAFGQVAAVACVRRLRRVRVYSPNPAHRRAFLTELRAEFKREVVEAGSLEEATTGAPIVTLATRATTPFLDAAMLAPGAHVNALGAVTGDGAEVSHDVFASAQRIVVDDLPAARRLSRELREFCGSDEPAWSRVETLAQVAAGKLAREGSSPLTVFKSVRSGLADLVLGIEIHRRVLRAGGGREIPQPDHVRPRLLPGGLD